MIEQDSYWRSDLIRFGERLEKRYRQQKWSNRTRYNVEKEVFLSFYIIRKLIEGKKLDRAVVGSHYTVTKYPIVTGAQPSQDPKTFAIAYQLYRGVTEKLSPEALCHQFVHSYVFSPFTPFGRDMVGIFFASHRDSKTGLYYIPLVRVIEIIISAGRNRPKKLKLARESDAFSVKLGS